MIERSRFRRTLRSRQRGFFLNPYRFGVTPRPLDSYTTDLWAACWFKKLLTSYAGYCFRMRRSSDDAELDIGFSGNSPDWAAALAFTGGGDGFLVKLYSDINASGGYQDMYETSTPSRQPRLIASGVVDGFARFDGSNDSMQLPTTGGANTAFTAFLKGNLRSPSGTLMVLEHSIDASMNNGAAWYYNSGATAYAMSRNSGSNIVSGSVSSHNAFDDSIVCLRVNASEASNTNKIKYYKNGTFVAGSPTATGTPTGAFANTNYFIGSRSNSSLFSPLNLTGLVIYHAALSDADIASISSALAAA